MSEKDLVIAGRDGAVGTITLNQPKRRNAINLQMWSALGEIAGQYAADPQVRVVVVTGAAGAFSAGADISQFEKQRATTADVAAYDAVSVLAYQRMAQMPKPTIAKIQGYCIGGGLGYALCCDLRIAAKNATFAIPAAKLGLAYSFDDVQALTSLVGESFAKEILFTGRQFDAAEALAMGLVNRVVPVSELDDYVMQYAETIGGNAPLTVRAAKVTVNEVQKAPAERALDNVVRAIDACYASEDYQEGRRAFAEKRKPQFAGR